MGDFTFYMTLPGALLLWKFLGATRQSDSV